MTRPPTPNPAALAPTPTPAAPTGAGAAAWPVFVPRSEAIGARVEVTFACPACREWGAVDDVSNLCRPCWRVLIALAEMLRDMRGAP